MSLAGLAALAGAAIAGFFVAMAGLKRLAQRHAWPAELQRKIIHIGTGLFAMALPWLFADDWPIYVILGLAMGVMAVLRLPMVRQRGLGTALHGVKRRSYGDVLLAISVGLCLQFSEREPILYLLPLAVLTLGDAAAALAGSAYGRRFFAVEGGHKSFEGSTIFFLVTMLLAMICLLLLTDVPRAQVILLAVLVSAFATLVEADSWRGYDNLFLPMGVLIFLAANLQSPAGILLAQAMGLLGALLIFHALAARLGLSGHGARVYVVAAFLIGAVTAPQNAALPVLMLALHPLARSLTPSTEEYPDLDIVAALAIVSFGFLLMGRVVGPTALSFYGIAMGGMALALAALASAGQPGAWAWRGLALALVAGLWALALGWNPAQVSAWHGPLWPVALGLWALCLALPSLQPGVFAAARSAKIAGLAAVPAALLYLAYAMMETP